MAPRETRLLDLRRDIFGRRILPWQGGIIVTHTGVPGAVRAHGQVENPELGYSSGIIFANLLSQKTQRLDANGLRLSAAGESLTPLVTIHNFSVDPTVVTGRLDYTLNGRQSPAIFVATSPPPEWNLAIRRRLEACPSSRKR